MSSQCLLQGTMTEACDITPALKTKLGDAVRKLVTNVRDDAGKVIQESASITVIKLKGNSSQRRPCISLRICCVFPQPGDEVREGGRTRSTKVSPSFAKRHDDPAGSGCGHMGQPLDRKGLQVFGCYPAFEGRKICR